MDPVNMPVDSMMNQMPVDQMDAFPEYFVSLDPPILLIGAALLFSVLSGVAFQGALVEDLNNWKADPKARSITSLQNINLILPFLGMAIGSSFFFLRSHNLNLSQSLLKTSGLCPRSGCG